MKATTKPSTRGGVDQNYAEGRIGRGELRAAEAAEREKRIENYARDWARQEAQVRERGERYKAAAVDAVVTTRDQHREARRAERDRNEEAKEARRRRLDAATIRPEPVEAPEVCDGPTPATRAVAALARLVCADLEIEFAMFVSTKRHPLAVLAREMVVYIARKYQAAFCYPSFPEIAQGSCRSNHSTFVTAYGRTKREGWKGREQAEKTYAAYYRNAGGK